MHLRVYRPVLSRGIIAGAVMLAGLSACSRSDRAGSETGSNQEGRTTTAVSDSTATAAGQQTTSIQTDTATRIATTTPRSADTARATGSDQSSGSRSSSTRATTSHADTADVSGYQAMGGDASASDTASSPVASAAPIPTDTSGAKHDSVVVGDSANIGKTGERLESTQSSQQANSDTLANQPGSDRIRPPEDSTETVGVASSDTAGLPAAGSDSVYSSAEMVRDTSSAADSSTIMAQVDTQQTEMAQKAPADTGTIGAQVDTSTQVDTAGQETGMAQQNIADSSAVQVQVDTTSGQTEMAQRAPVDTEAVQSQSDTTNAQQPSETAAQQPEAVQSDSAAVGAASVQSSGHLATGPEAVALVSREGRRCAVVDAEEEADARWDLAASPATMNPCGTGTMTLPRVQAER